MEKRTLTLDIRAYHQSKKPPTLYALEAIYLIIEFWFLSTLQLSAEEDGGGEDELGLYLDGGMITVWLV